MTHKNEDELLAFALEVVTSEEERAGITQHLAVCPDCRARLESIRADIGAIAGVRPSYSFSLPPTGRTHPALAFSILRAAALVAVGLVVGFGAGSRAGREPVFVSPAYVETSTPTAPQAGTAVSDATDVPEAYYEQTAR